MSGPLSLAATAGPGSGVASNVRLAVYSESSGVDASGERFLLLSLGGRSARMTSVGAAEPPGSQGASSAAYLLRYASETQRSEPGWIDGRWQLEQFPCKC